MESMILGFKDGSRKHETCLCISYKIMKAFASKKIGEKESVTGFVLRLNRFREFMRLELIGGHKSRTSYLSGKGMSREAYI